MKRAFLFLVASVISITVMAQSSTYLVFEFMKVENSQEADYWDTESFWEKIHAERVKSGEIKSWDLWSLKPGGTSQGYQYLTVTVFDDMNKALNGGDVFGNAKKAYPNLSENDLMEALDKSAKSRDLSVRMYLQIVGSTTDEFKMDPGTLVKINLMKAKEPQYMKYETAERELFLPEHQKLVDAGVMGHWSMARVLLPSGSNAKITHMTFDMFSDTKHFIGSFNRDENLNPDKETIMKMEKALDLRDLTWSYLATLIKTVK